MDVAAMTSERDGRRGRREGDGSKEKKPSRASSVQYPERLDVGEDANEDVAAFKGDHAEAANQTFFSMITKAGSNTDFHRRFDDESSDSDEDAPYPAHQTSSRHVIPTKINPPIADEQKMAGVVSEQSSSRSDSQTSLHVNRSRLEVQRLHVETAELDDPMSHSMLLPPRQPEELQEEVQESPKRFNPRTAPVMSQMLEAQADLLASDHISDKLKSDAAASDTSDRKTIRKSLPEQLKEIFGFEGPEDVVAEYPCWLTQSVLLQGYMYITQQHVCFYAYAPKRSHAVVKSGHLAKRGKQNPKYARYWFELKGDELSYRTDPTDPYFRSGNIDLRFGISASLNDPKDKSKGSKDFSVITPYRDYHFRADSVSSAKEWVKQLQRVIFRSHNKGDSVKISMPIENIMDVEESPVMDIAETVKVRVADADENFAVFAVEEYFFTFFGNGEDALKVLQTLVEDTVAQKIPENLLVASSISDESRSREPSRPSRSRKAIDVHPDSPSESGTPILREPVRASIGPYSPILSSQNSPRPSGEFSRNSLNLDRKGLESKRKSLDTGRRSVDFTGFGFRRAQSEKGRRSASNSRTRPAEEHHTSQSSSTIPQASIGSVNSSSGRDSDLLSPKVPTDHPNMSSSQILDPTDLHHPLTTEHIKFVQDRITFPHGGDKHRMPSEIRIRPPTRSQSEQTTSSKRSRGERTSGDLTPTSSPTLQQLVKAGNYPLQRAAGFAGYLKSRSKRLSNRLATGSMGYVEKVSGIWAGGQRHYTDQEAVILDPLLDISDPEDNSDGSGDRFRSYFALPSTEKLRATFFGWLHRGVPIHGKIYMSRGRFCFRSLFPGSKTKMVLPVRDIENVHKERGFRFGYSGFVIVVRGHEEIFFDFKSDEIRNDCAVTLLALMEQSKDLLLSGSLSQEERQEAEIAKAEHKLLQAARKSNKEVVDDIGPEARTQPILFDDPRASILNFKPTESLKITCLTIGSRGDVQPYIALCKGFIHEGHKPRIATHVEFKDWIEKHGIEFAPVEGDPAELMRICVENGMFTISFLKEASVKFRGWIDELLSSAWKACQDTDVLIESPSAMAGSHIAEALGIPYYRAFTMPWTRTRAYPHAFVVPAHKKGGTYNEMSYYLFDQVFWKAIAGQVNRWRKKELGLRSTDLTKMAPHRVPFLYNFSPKVVPPPLDYSDWVHVTGYWFLDEATDWKAPQALLDFISKARSDGKKLVYIGFGSIVVSDPAALTKTVIDSVHKADVRCILSKGWSDRLGNHDAALPEVPLPPDILQIKSAPHDWLFKQIDAAAHHGGAGTTGASLRAGLPTIIKPFFGDQYFFGTRVEDLGVGICLKKLNVSVFSRALWEATHSQRMISKATLLGEQIRTEDGVATAIQTIYRDLEYAKSLIKRRAHLTNDGNINDEEWTLIGDDDDPELVKRIHDLDIHQLHAGMRKSFQLAGRESLDLGA